ncbi:concanavalin A-like lectin/glucanase domain-containing protein [Polychytrium aggregatum]|uniref:concanavalin A-like lectin/glucanase domain-containing protein n=1 Tax=Polychytrium aggregatum TaxID=110093 RepID=UPI0022FE8B50|nr:concanavalin A-like lectin/glucanase domain-containing protein [Polychytrium aggregatum]KAI9208886.1 concanavalin A-like lectin/glucanase domain-containing protein [Polychytrium aggregatum]
MVKTTAAVALVVASMAVAAVSADPATNGNCVSGRFNFSNIAPRVFYNKDASRKNPPFPEADRSLYDFTLDNGAENAKFDSNGMTITLTKQIINGSNYAYGAQLSTNFYVNYGKITVSLSAPAEPGIVTTFYTMSAVKDEIDMEIVGKETTTIQSNVFYRGIPEFGVHMQRLTIPNSGAVNGMHQYTIDWNRNRLIWLIDGVPLRTLYKNQSVSLMNTTKDPWYPTTPSIIQMTCWDGGDVTSSPGTSTWAGGPPSWSVPNYQAVFQYLDIQCYDDNDNPVDVWPPNSAPTGTASGPQSTGTSAPGSKSGAPKLLQGSIAGAALLLGTLVFTWLL